MCENMRAGERRGFLSRFMRKKTVYAGGVYGQEVIISIHNRIKI